ncbi:MAG: hypothetical protein PF489_08115 [Salinivirgaceae bacterium]|jgi:hypothetical protein|nr:hypothetical protein [Salinivirgaceae bacterium]
MAFQQPSIEILGVLINEPVTVGTDLKVSAVCIYAFFKLLPITSRGRLKFYLLMYFMLMALATATGGLIGHAFLWHFTATWENPEWVNAIIDKIAFLESHEPAYAWKLPGWIMSMLSIMYVERAAIEQVRPIVKPGIGRAFRLVNLFELLLFMAITLATLNFRYVEIHSGYGLMFVVLSLQSYAYYRTNSQGSKLFIIGVAVAAVAALFYMNEIGISQWFNHFDISHTLMAVSAFIFYKGSVRMLRDDHSRLARY